MSENGKDIRRALKAAAQTPKKPNPYKDDVIYDPMGQWKYPGQVTRIPSNNITMQGVPYPVLGVDNLGNQQMMQPGAHYTFPGEYVTEYPMAQKGRQVVHTDKAAYNKAHRAEMDSLTIYNAFKNLKDKHKDSPVKSIEKYTKSWDKNLDNKSSHVNIFDNGAYSQSDYYADPFIIDEDRGMFEENLIRISEKINPTHIAQNYEGTKEHRAYVDNLYPIYKKPVIHNKYQKPEPVVEPVKEQSKKEQPKKTEAPKKDYTTRNVDFSSPYGPVMKYYDESGKVIRTEPYIPQQEYGGWLDNIDEEFRRGGPVNPLMLSRSKRRKTSKNIQSSINKLFLRNRDLFGPGGKNIYDPKSKYEYGGGWLDQMQEGASVIPKLRHKQDMADAYAAAADFKNSNRVSSTAVNKFIPSLTEEDIAAAEANKEFAKLPKAQQDAIIMQNQAMYSRGPEAQLSQGKKLTEEEQAYSDKVSRRIKYPFSDIGIAAGNVASYLGRFEGMSPEEIAASTNNPMGALGVSSDVASEAMINEMLGVGSSKLFKKGVQRAYGLHKYPNLPDLGLEPLPNGAHDPSTFKSMKDVGLEQQMAQARDAEAEAIHKKAFPLLEFQQPTIKPFGPSSARDKAMNNLKAIDDWHNWDTKYKGKNIAIDETGKKVGAFNEGVFEIKGHPEYVGKVEDINPSGKDARTVGEMYPHLDIEELHRGITSKNIGKVVKQIRHPDDITKRILISEKVHGTPWEKLTPRQFAKIPMEAHIQLDADMRHLRNNGLAVDWMGNNILYNPKEKAFKILDISPTKTTMGPTMTANWDQRIIKGVDQGLPNSQSAKLMRNAHLEKYNINQTLGLDGFQARAHGFDDVPFAKNTIDRMQLQSQMDSNPLSYWQNLYLQKAETISKRKHMELSRLLSKQPVDKMGGAWLDKLF